MRNSSIVEAERYASQLLPLKSDIYRNGSSSYSNFKILLLNKEVSVPKLHTLSSGVLPEIQAFWYATQENLFFNLHIFRYDLNSVEVLPSFPSSICFVKVYRPPRGVFNSKIQCCLLVVTETDVIVYGIEADTHCIINTDFSAKLYSKPVCVKLANGNIFLGCADGNVYCASCRSVDFLNYKYLSLYSPGHRFSGASLRSSPAKRTRSPAFRWARSIWFLFRKAWRFTTLSMGSTRSMELSQTPL
ncbi:uncharacterized protein VICG_01569 [Vittaforma corneae ATCC 50505]|uniref:Nucleoporin Nup133/Nup155-like N-terminal domain-containing protein n=1 Tax=Vittaforma corneae (strain ATCC 50505) TaxID=993615 RepID=L2GL17_VITCO|nr:uncharacterized protein VICG_01569 [Vittaforma corneae ATCC 50505]ELA41329.1 hypothetical protein VICG_01569 [Vittaforma corneae ATCC 50505]